ncbi:MULTISPECIES: 4-fold beta flower protein [unclassified Variovorax]|uniref:4-fold beta flower protein n=1 Tax=unclassified Variovorax TaxID=663243 RepID=UPI00076DC230|nr:MULTISPECIES: hypothetical protein [unclassified Variovorax]KWT95605.1 hypothetical protein APY03_2482 [Variovorax sp. WDL1]PNG50216.1 hypothetical protein CHC06_05839 [Variovorax sp. B2]PNG51089.1 hypothetical protein CHC07_05745 [Variovorax sp. B4]VTU42374.1 hypothetical protein SRS16P1_00254 [Variovorax sp. SRS16]VTU42401.1 hypothetical protein E5P1_00252 [Variovorax sp. PBL-E5]
MKHSLFAASLLALALVTPAAHADDEEVALFSGSGRADAYIAIAEELTIYLWGGKPVAYLEKNDTGGGYHVYGFNGKHLGWFTKGVVWDSEGYASCATKEALKTTAFEPFKSFKEFKPFKAFKEFAPFRPSLTSTFGETPCRFLLGAGGAG